MPHILDEFFDEPVSVKVSQKIKGRNFDRDFARFRAYSHCVLADEVLETSAIDVFHDESHSLLTRNPEIFMPFIQQLDVERNFSAFKINGNDEKSGYLVIDAV